MPKKILYGAEARAALKSGVDQIADGIKVTLGAKGRNVIIGRHGFAPIITKDGVTVARHITLSDPIEHEAAMLIREVAIRAWELTGDGTTTATVLAQQIVNEGITLINNGTNPMELKKGIDKAVEQVVASLKQQAIEVTPETLVHVATVSANGDAEIGKLVADTYNKLGKDCVIKIEDGNTFESEMKITEGMQVDSGYIDQWYVTNPYRMVCEMKNVAVLIYDKKIDKASELLGVKNGDGGVFGKVLPSGKSLLIICAELEGEAYGTVHVNRERSNIPVCVIRCPGFGENRKRILDDIAVLTGGTVISEQNGYTLEKLTVNQLGVCDAITVTKDACTFIGGKGSSDKIKERVEQLRVLSEQSESIRGEREALLSRAAKLAGGVAVMYVGGNSDVEVKEKKDRCDDAVRACKAALEEGIVPGGGMALLRSKVDIFDYRQDVANGMNLIATVLQSPFRQMCRNAGIDPDTIVLEDGKGFNFATEQYEDLMASGIIDPVKVVRIALESAASIASTMLTSECLMVDYPEKQQ